MSSTPQFNTEQLSAARAKAWHQAGEPLLTLDAAREWLTEAGLLLFAPRPQHVAAPAPSLVEATLGAANEAPSAAESETARSLVARLVSEGNALPLNLLGGPGDLPDFIVSAQIFSFIFTLRGDKLWKQAPATSGSVKVSPLSLAVYEMLTERGALSAAELASELGREVTEAAILRSLNELWTLLRVIPLLQQGEAATLWELTSRRFTKTIKAGVNAGQPTALSALVSLYLAQALLGTEEEISAFLSPLAPRSRIREVIHGLTAARQLEPIVLEGKTLLHVPGTLPEFPAATEALEEASTEGEGSTETTEAQPTEEGRIKRFTRSATSAPRSDFKGRPARTFSAGARDRSPARKTFGDKPERTDRERRPFRRDSASAGAAAAGEKPTFTRPWDEDRKPRRESPAAEGESSAPAKRTYDRAARPAAGSYRPREGSSDRGPARKTFGDKPAFRKDRGEGFASKPRFPKDGERKPYVRRESSAPAEASDRPRRTFGAGGDREGFRPKPRFAADGERKPFKRRDEGGTERPEARPRRTFGGDEGAKPRFNREDRGDRKPGGFAPKRPYVRRDGDAGDRPARPSFGAKRTFGDRPARPFRSETGDGPKPRSFGDRPPRPARSESGGSARPRTFSDRPARPSRGETGDGPKPRSFGARGDRPSGPPRGKFGPKSGGSSFGSRPSGRPSFGAKPGFGKRPASTRPAGTRPPTRKPRPEGE